MSLETSYRGHVIRYSENSEKWQCSDLDEHKWIESEKLSGVKAAIDRIYLNLRKVAGLECFELADGWTQAAPNLVEARLVEYLGPKIEGNWSKGTREVVGHKVASVARRAGSSKASRQHGELSNYIPDTPEARAAFDAFVVAWRKQKEAEKATKAARDAIPRVTIEMVEELIRIYESENTKEAEK